MDTETRTHACCTPHGNGLALATSDDFQRLLPQHWPPPEHGSQASHVPPGAGRVQHLGRCCDPGSVVLVPLLGLFPLAAVPTFLAPSTGLMEDNFSTDGGGEWFGDDSSTLH